MTTFRKHTWTSFCDAVFFNFSYTRHGLAWLGNLCRNAERRWQILNAYLLSPFSLCLLHQPDICQILQWIIRERHGHGRHLGCGFYYRNLVSRNFWLQSSFSFRKMKAVKIVKFFLPAWKKQKCSTYYINWN